MQKHRVFKKSAFCVVIIAVVFAILFGTIYIRRSMEFAFFGDIRGLHPYIRLYTQYDDLIGHMGEPIEREVTVLPNGNELYALHYEGIIFTLRNNRVVAIDIIGVQYSLGGQRNIGVGSSRRQVERDLWWRQRANFWTRDCGCSRLIVWRMDDGSISFLLHNQRMVISFDENNNVARMQLTHAT